MARLALGLDSSTQSITATIVDADSCSIIAEHSLNYLDDSRLTGFGLNENYILPPGEPGEALQPAGLYVASTDAILEDLARILPDCGHSISEIRAINVSGQQHGHLFLSADAAEILDKLDSADTTKSRNLLELTAGLFALDWARIWRTSNTSREADETVLRLGGRKRIIELTGSSAPLRFSAFGIRKTALEWPEQYRSASIIHQISTLIPALLAGKADIPLDWGNACGTSMMDYSQRVWSDDILYSLADDLPGHADVLRAKLPSLASAKTEAGMIAGYFRRRFGFAEDCRVLIGSGDNPQSKVLTDSTLLSLGSSFVIMTDNSELTKDRRGYANAMYDALDRPFIFGCRTNGALRWDEVRTAHGLAKKDYLSAEKALENTPPGNLGRIYFRQPEAESFPPNGEPVPQLRFGYEEADFAADYAGAVESSLASVFLASRDLDSGRRRIYLTGGPSSSAQVLRRVAAIWNREVVPISGAGASLGAAATAAAAAMRSEPGFDPVRYCASFVKAGEPVIPDPRDVVAYHGADGFLNKYFEIEGKIRTKAYGF